MSDKAANPTSDTETALQQWLEVSRQLHMLRSGQIRDADFGALARTRQTLLGMLPSRYATVLSDLLDRLESSALFTEESCSFSRKDLLESLQMWLDKARQQLPA